MRLCCISDTHQLHSRIKGLGPADILLHAGDFTNVGKPLEVSKFSHWLEELNEEYDYKDIVVIPGNHDFIFERDYNFAKSCLTAATVLNQTLTTIDGLTIYGEPRTIEFNNWAFNVPHNRMAQVWERIPPGVDVLLTHGPPAGVLDTTARGERVGCPHLYSWIEEYKPKLVVCGHIHEGYGTAKIGNTTIINASICNFTYKPVNDPIFIDLE